MAKVLVADDIADMRNLLRALLQRDGHEVFEAADGKAVLRVLEEQGEFDLLLLDINMPELSGIEAMAEVKKDFPDVKVCFISGDRDKKTVLSAMQAGGNDYIVKPIDPVILNQKLAKILGTDKKADEFATIKVRTKAELLGLPMPVDFWLTEMSEVHLVFESPIPFNTGGLIEIKSQSISDIIGSDFIFPCRVMSVDPQNDLHFVKCSFVGIHENARKQIRSLVMKGKEIFDKDDS